MCCKTCTTSCLYWQYCQERSFVRLDAPCLVLEINWQFSYQIYMGSSLTAVFSFFTLQNKTGLSLLVPMRHTTLNLVYFCLRNDAPFGLAPTYRKVSGSTRVSCSYREYDIITWKQKNSDLPTGTVGCYPRRFTSLRPRRRLLQPLYFLTGTRVKLKRRLVPKLRATSGSWLFSKLIFHPHFLGSCSLQLPPRSRVTWYALLLHHHCSACLAFYR